ncbi:MAG: hypothetical protein IJX39_04690 [Clostridia bacterium]|nr:hypothetical protein [Clostridia bacterium]
MEGLTKEDMLTLRLEIAELRREMAELRREIAELRREIGVRELPPFKVNFEETERKGEPDEVSTEQIVTEWLEGEDAWKTREKK